MPIGSVRGAVHEYQTEWPPALPAWSGSPVCLVASKFEPETEVSREIAWASAKSSLAGAAASALAAKARQMRAAASSAPTVRPTPETPRPVLKSVSPARGFTIEGRHSRTRNADQLVKIQYPGDVVRKVGRRARANWGVGAL